jgi:uncharacterized protein (AIM24 family)
LVVEHQQKSTKINKNQQKESAMSYNGSGTFVINTAGQPVVAGQTFTATDVNALNQDIATGLSTAITKDGQTTTTAAIPFAQGLTSNVAIGISSGGTNATATPTAGAVPYGTGTAYAFTSSGTAGQVLTSNGSSAPTWAAAAAGGITYTRVTSTTTLTNNQGVIADTTGGSFTVNLPASPSTGAQVWLADGGAWGTNNLTVGRNGSTIEGAAENLVCDITGVGIQMLYDGTTWQVYAQAGAFGSSFTGTGSVVLATSPTITTATLVNPTITNYTETAVTANTSTAYTIDNTNGTLQILTLTGNCTFTFPTATAGKSFTLFLKQDATGSRTVTWPASVKWPGGTAPTITATASKADKYVFTADGSSWVGSNAGQNYTL